MLSNHFIFNFHNDFWSKFVHKADTLQSFVFFCGDFDDGVPYKNSNITDVCRMFMNKIKNKKKPNEIY